MVCGFVFIGNEASFFIIVKARLLGPTIPIDTTSGGSFMESVFEADISRWLPPYGGGEHQPAWQIELHSREPVGIISRLRWIMLRQNRPAYGIRWTMIECLAVSNPRHECRISSPSWSWLPSPSSSGRFRKKNEASSRAIEYTCKIAPMWPW